MGKINRFTRRYGMVLASFAIVAAQLSTAQACFLFFHQPKVPKNL